MFQAKFYRFAVFVLLSAWLAVALWVADRNVREAASLNTAASPQTLATQSSDATAHISAGVPKSTGANADASESSPGLFVATIRRPDGPPRIDSGVVDPQGRSGTVACSTCHSVREPNFANRTPGDLDQFHQGMAFSHGSTTCYSCHNPEDTDTLRLADSTKVDYVDVMTLCAQCHGPQWRDYQHGVHGGMNGYWDLTRGPQTRNNCIDCHDPHVPAFPKMQPTFKPRDRFLSPPADKDHGKTDGAAESPIGSRSPRRLPPRGLGSDGVRFVGGSTPLDQCFAANPPLLQKSFRPVCSENTRSRALPGNALHPRLCLHCLVSVDGVCKVAGSKAQGSWAEQGNQETDEPRLVTRHSSEAFVMIGGGFSSLRWFG
ncbi:putative secreted protein [Rhodopirellula maiorica SM1]|uniref:Putative secreted protein n=1 Tax=Rhodopirellula maiorica SM1 TaxID=1265738 RepID=M5S174_9BACT|nr:putative secreted protein [Rhodopirellula maiorica SM1]